MHNVDDILSILEQIETELKSLGLYGGPLNRPNEEAFLSQMPFCLDTMDFHQWLEYVLIERLRLLIQNKQELPKSLLVHTAAQEYYRGSWYTYKDLIALLRQLDGFFA